MPASDEGVLDSGTVIAGCRVVRLLGRGGMGEVYLAKHLRLDCNVALKILPFASLGSQQNVARFRKEAKLAAKIRHPNVLRVIDVGEEGGHHYILMDYVEGSNLHELVRKQGGPLPWKQALRLVQFASRGTAAVHKLGLVHRDIKPANIMLSTGKEVLLMDFGLAREQEGSELTRTGALLGTPAFMSPEQSRAEPVDARSDVFSLGGTLYYLLTARLPYEGNQAQVLGKLITDQRPRPAHEVNSYVPRPVSDLVSRAMEPKARDRFATVEALEKEIGRLIKSPIAAPAAPTPETGDASSEATGPQVDPRGGGPRQGPTLDLVPLETEPASSLLGRARSLLPWAAALVVVGLCAGVVWWATQGGGSNAVGPDGGGNKKDEKDGLKPGMVKVTGGAVVVGNEEDELRRHALTLEGVKDDLMLINDFLQNTTHPSRKGQVGSFWMDKYEVTNAEYAEFVQKAGGKPPKHWKGEKSPPADLAQHPVVNVSHADAAAYAAWAGKKLPTEEQWVRAFRGDTKAMYPWGDKWESNRANVQENKELRAGTCPVTATPKDVSPFGVCNMAGNVCEMLRDQVPREGKQAVVAHGADWKAVGRVYGVAAFPFFYEVDLEVNETVGFRCVVEE
jgi:formylglycine-generating enzyme required for sulfatase activity/predicted Ser/Thr protein kinase